MKNAPNVGRSIVTCPSCGEHALKVLYLGAPMKLCSSERCSTLWGMFSWLAVCLPVSINGYWAFYVYSCGYPRALWRWLANVLTRETAAGNYTMPDKARPESKIDAAMALFLAMTRAMLGPPKPNTISYRGLRSV